MHHVYEQHPWFPVKFDTVSFDIYDLAANILEDTMSKSWIGRFSMAALLVVALAISASDLAAQFQPQGSLGALAPANIAKPRPKPPFDLTGTWLHGGESERFDPPAGFKLTPEAQKHYDAAQKA